MPATEPSIYLVYDGDCPVCAAYCTALALKKIDANFQIINARESHPIVEKVRETGLDMDEGFVLGIDGEHYHGADAINRLALMGTPVGIFNKLNYLVFRSKFLSRMLYPVLLAGRNTLLKILGVRKLNATPQPPLAQSK